MPYRKNVHVERVSQPAYCKRENKTFNVKTGVPGKVKERKGAPVGRDKEGFGQAEKGCPEATPSMSLFISWLFNRNLTIPQMTRRIRLQVNHSTCMKVVGLGAIKKVCRVAGSLF